MSALLEIRQQIDHASERIARMEQQFATNPGYSSIAANLSAAIRIRAKLETQFLQAAESARMDVCRYRAFADDEARNAAAAFSAVAAFQKLVSVVYGAVIHGPKPKATVTEKEAKESAFGFGYGFTGSVGVVLTVPSPTPIFDASPLDDAIEYVFAMAKADTPDQIKEFATKLGAGPISALHQWSNENVSNGLGAEVEWRRGSNLKASLLIQRQQLHRLNQNIDATSSARTDYIDVIGDIIAADLESGHGKFKLVRSSDLRKFKGTVEPGAIDRKHQVTLPRQYVAKLRRTTIKHSATGESNTTYHLMSLRNKK